MPRFHSALLLVLMAAAPPTNVGKPTIAPDEQQQLDQAMARGKQIFDYDQAAWHTTDTMLADVKRDDLNGIAGWVVVPDPKGFRATYFKRNAAGPYGYYTAIWTGQAVVDRKILSSPFESALNAQQLAIIAARDAASAIATRDKLMLCANAPFNSVVLPGAENGVIMAYLLTPQTRTGVYPMGGHHLLQYKDGKEIARRSFSKSCIDIGDPSPKSRKKSVETVAVFVTHLLDPIPTEIHAFTAYSSAMPLYVATVPNDKTWSITIKEGKASATLVELPSAKAK